ncbi:hypothetical protein [Halovivax sp.]|uniref:hypothetical protein n=1 Tax=Halovivax sp. TaxID=1935978 RepID=UPI0025BF22BA|nr:hypothetical protein [Halovivax sp.]
MDVTQVGFGVVLIGVASLMVVGRSISDSGLFVYFLAAAALVLSAYALVICVLRDRGRGAERGRHGV